MNSGFNRDYAAEQVRRSRHPLRQIIKQFYLRNILCDVLPGAAIDLGCGAGQLLAKLPAGSVGLEVNPFLVEVLQFNGLNAQLYDAESDHFLLSTLQKSHYKTLIMAHVLEHMADAAITLRVLLDSCRRIGICRVILVLPGTKGFRSDPTHKTFIDKSYIEREDLMSCQGYTVTKLHYFPLNFSYFGDFYTFHELKVIYDLTETDSCTILS